MPTVYRIKNLIFVIHTRDHGHPHVTVYFGTPKNYQAMCKVRLDEVDVLESHGFSEKDCKFILKIVLNFCDDWLEVWNEIQEKQD